MHGHAHDQPWMTFVRTPTSDSPVWQKLCLASLLYSMTFTAIELSKAGTVSIALASEEGR